MKLTTTQVEILKEAAASRFGRAYTTLVGGRGPDGGIRRGGARKSDAACKLRDAGLLVFVEHEHTSDARNGFTVHYTTGIWSITDAGRLVAATL